MTRTRPLLAASCILLMGTEAQGAQAARSRPSAERQSDAFLAATGHRSAFTVVRDGEVITTSPVRILKLPFGLALLTKAEIKDGCHACKGALGIHYLKLVRGHVSVAKSWPEAIEGWGWGAAPRDWYMTDKFTRYPAVYSSGGYTGQGITESSAFITELRPDGPVTSEVIHIGYTNEGAVDESRACTVKGKITNIRRDRSFDIVVTGSVHAVHRYGKRNGKFVAISKVDWDMGCGD